MKVIAILSVILAIIFGGLFTVEMIFKSEIVWSHKINIARMLEEQPELATVVREAYRGDDVITIREYFEIVEAYDYLVYQETILKINHAIVQPPC